MSSRPHTKIAKKKKSIFAKKMKSCYQYTHDTAMITFVQLYAIVIDFKI